MVGAAVEDLEGGADRGIEEEESVLNDCLRKDNSKRENAYLRQETYTLDYHQLDTIICGVVDKQDNKSQR